MRLTGIRIGELRCLQFDCIRQHTASQNFLKVELGKLNTERLVPIDAGIVEFIHKIQKKTRRYTKDPVRLIHRPNGKVPNQNDFFEAFREVTDKLKFKTPVVPHQMRHTYATELLNAGMNLSVIKELLGHKSLKMTTLYAKVTLQTVVEEYRKASANYQSKFVIQKLEPPPDSGSDNPREMLSDLILTLKKSKRTKHQARNPTHSQETEPY